MTETLQTACPLDCPDACSLAVEVEDGRLVSVDAGPANPFTDGVICGKVRRIADHVYGSERLLTPAVRRGAKGEGLFEPVPWDEALDLVARRMLEVKERAGAEAILPLCYGGSNGALTQDSLDARLFRRLGASVLERAVCAYPTSHALAGMYGRMHGVGFPGYEDARLIVVWGMNPSASGIHLVPVIQRARERGAKLVVVDPRRIPVAKDADLHLAPRVGTDLPLALAVIRWLFENGAADEAFLTERATGADELRRRAAPWTLERAAEVCGLDASAIEGFARLYAETNPAVVRCGWGLERNRNGTSAVCAVLALPAVAGKFGVRGGGYTLSNGAVWKLTGAVDDPEPDARRVNMNVVGKVLTGAGGPPIELLFVYNANPLATLPNQELVREGLEREDLFTVVFDQVLTDTARYADVVLPATTFLEHDELSRGYGVPVLQRSRSVIDRVGESRPNDEVFGELCRRTGVARPDDVTDGEELANALLASLPDRERVERELADPGAALPACGADPVLFADVFPGTPDRRVHLVPESLDGAVGGELYAYLEEPDAGRLALISPATARRTSSTFGQLVPGEVPLELHPDDAAARGIADGDGVRVFNELGEVRTSARLNPDLRRGVALLPKGLWDRNTRSGNTANALAPDDLEPVVGGACFNDARVEVEPG